MRFTFYLYFSRDRDARKVADRLERAFEVEVHAPDGDVAEWAVLATRDLEPNVLGARFALTEWRLRALAARHRGEYDGHSADLRAAEP